MNNHVSVGKEKKCGYMISENRKKLWNYELDMLDMLEKTCVENEIDYFFIFGSALGAARHNGFIPWDDDIDIGMLRKDFEIFRKCSKHYFPDYIDIQYGISENGVDLLMRIRDKRTTGIIRGETKKKINKGIFIEIYVYDYTDNTILGKFQVGMSRILCNVMCVINSNSKSVADCIKRVLLKIIPITKVWNLYERICKLYSKTGTCYVSVVSLPRYAMQKRFTIDYDVVKKSKYVDFENSKVRVPKENEKYLKQLYGNYMELPPIEKRGTQHENIVFYDPNKSYLEYENSDVPEKYFNGDSTLELL